MNKRKQFGHRRALDLKAPGPSEECGFHAPSYCATGVAATHPFEWVGGRAGVGRWLAVAVPFT